MHASLPVIRPDDPTKIAWDLVVFVFVVIAVVLAPLALALSLTSTGLVLILDVLINIVFVADIMVQFRTGFAERREVITDPVRIRARYLRQGFFLDVVASLPFFLIPGGGLVTVNRLARFVRLTRMLKIFVIFRQLNRFRNTRVRSNAIRVVLMIFWLLITAHMVACGLLLVGGVSEDYSPAMRYLQALYWTITTLATVGYGDITPDHNNPVQLIFTIVAQMVGVGMYGFVIGNIASVISNIDVAKSAFMEKIEKVNIFMQYREVPDELQRRINDYYYYLWDTRRGYDETAIVAELPRSIRVQMAQEIHRDVIATVPLFKNATPAFIRDIVLHLEPVAFTPGDYIVRNGEPGDEMFFINRGTVDVMSDDESRVHATLRDGSFFGEIALLASTTRTASIIARDYCDLYSLHQSAFELVLKKYPDFERSVREMAALRFHLAPRP